MLLPHIKLYWKAKGGLELDSLAHLLHDFWRKRFLLLYCMTWPNIIVWLPLLREILGNMCIVIVCWPGCDAINVEINLIFLIKLFSAWPKRQGKNLNILKTKELLRWNKEHFPLFLKDFHWSKLNKFLWTVRTRLWYYIICIGFTFTISKV